MNNKGRYAGNNRIFIRLFLLIMVIGINFIAYPIFIYASSTQNREITISITNSTDNIENISSRGCVGTTKNSVNSTENINNRKNTNNDLTSIENTGIREIRVNTNNSDHRKAVENSTEATNNENSSKYWAFHNLGDFYYEDNASSWYSEIETVHAVKGMDINLMPVKEKNVEYKRETIVAIIDTGVDIDHPALKDGIWLNEDEIAGDGIDNDENGYIDDINGWNFYKNSNVVYNSRSSTEDAHGTHCAGTIIGYDKERNWSGIAGEISQIHVMPIKILGGIDGTGTFRDLIKGIKYAEKNGAVICNLSIGTDIWNEELYQVMKESKMLFVVAAGNGGGVAHGSGDNLEYNPMYPACYELENMIVVSNMKCDGNLHYSSFYGKNYVDVAAPGTRIYSTSTIKEGYEMMTGTSMAVPIVSGVAALLYSQHSEWDILYVKEAILNSCKKIDTLSEVVRTGGIPDVVAAVEYSRENSKEEVIPDKDETKDEESQTDKNESVSSDKDKTDKEEINPDGDITDEETIPDKIPIKDNTVPSEQETDVTKNPEVNLPPIIREDTSVQTEKPEKTETKIKIPKVKIRKVRYKKTKKEIILSMQIKGDYKTTLIVQQKKGKKKVQSKRIISKSKKWKTVKYKLKRSRGTICLVKVRHYRKYKGKTYYGAWRRIKG